MSRLVAQAAEPRSGTSFGLYDKPEKLARTSGRLRRRRAVGAFIRLCGKLVIVPDKFDYRERAKPRYMTVRLASRHEPSPRRSRSRNKRLFRWVTTRPGHVNIDIARLFLPGDLSRRDDRLKRVMCCGSTDISANSSCAIRSTRSSIPSGCVAAVLGIELSLRNTDTNTRLLIVSSN